MKRLTGFLINGFLMTLSSVLLQLIDSAFTIYISSKIGADGVGLFGLVTSVYRFAVTLSLSGLSLAATKKVAEKIAAKNPKTAVKISNRCLAFGLIIGTFVGVMLFSLSNFFAETVLGSPDTSPSLKVLSLSLPFLAMSSSISGYFTAVRKPLKGVISSVIAFFVRIVTTAVLLSTLQLNLRLSCLSVVTGMTVSEIAGFLIVFVLYIFDLRHLRGGEAEKRINSQILSVSVPIALSAYVRSALSTVEQLLIPKGLRKYGETQETALAKYGLIKGMVLPVILMPSSILYAFSGLLVPELTEAKAKDCSCRIEKIVSSVFSLSLIYSVAVCGILLFYADDISLMLYGSLTPAVYIKILAPLSVVMYLDGAVDNVLKGLGEQVYCMRINILDAFISLVLVAVLVPVYGINGYVFVILISEIFNTFFSVLKLIKITTFRINIFSHILLPCFFIVSSCSLFSLISRPFDSVPFWLNAGLSLCFYLFLCGVFSCSAKKNCLPAN